MRTILSSSCSTSRSNRFTESTMESNIVSAVFPLIFAASLFSLWLSPLGASSAPTAAPAATAANQIGSVAPKLGTAATKPATRCHDGQVEGHICSAARGLATKRDDCRVCNGKDGISRALEDLLVCFCGLRQYVR